VHIKFFALKSVCIPALALQNTGNPSCSAPGKL